MNLKITTLKEEHVIEYMKLLRLLWDDIEQADINDILSEHISTKNKVFVALIDHSVIGFINSSVRIDYVEGSKESPVGYIEGIFVMKDYRKLNIASKLVDEAADYFRSLGLTEIGSDTEFENSESDKFHQAIGFGKPIIIKHYIKKL